MQHSVSANEIICIEQWIEWLNESIDNDKGIKEWKNQWMNGWMDEFEKVFKDKMQVRIGDLSHGLTLTT